MRAFQKIIVLKKKIMFIKNSISKCTISAIFPLKLKYILPFDSPSSF